MRGKRRISLTPDAKVSIRAKAIDKADSKGVPEQNAAKATSRFLDLTPSRLSTRVVNGGARKADGKTRGTKRKLAAKETATDGTADQPIHLDSDSEGDSGKQKKSDDPVIRPDEVQKTCIVPLKDLSICIGTFPCTADVYFCAHTMVLCWIRGRMQEWPGRLHYEVNYHLIIESNICRPARDEAIESFKPQFAFMAMACELNDTSLESFYHPTGPDEAHRYILLCARDKMGAEFGMVEDLIRNNEPRIVRLISKSRRMEFLKVLEGAPSTTTELASKPRTRSAASRESNFEESTRQTVSATNSDVQLTYPLPPCVSDIVTITRQDVDRLQPERYLNDNIIDYYFKRLILEEFQGIKRIQNNVLFLSSHFYSQLRLGKGNSPVERIKAGYKNVCSWLTRSDFFKRSLIFVPINKDLHWSLAIIINPSIAGILKDEASSAETCIALLDPLGNYHSKASLVKQLKCFLSLEWESTRAEVGYDTEYDESKVVHVCVKAPQQQNSYDCGVFILKYAEVILKNYLLLEPTQTTNGPAWMQDIEWIPQDITNGSLELLISSKAFSSDDIKSKRRELLDLVEVDTARFLERFEKRAEI